MVLMTSEKPLMNPKPMSAPMSEYFQPTPPPSHEFVTKNNPRPSEPFLSHSIMKKTFLEKMVPLSPLLLPPFHIFRGKKNINLHPPPL